MAEDDIKIKVLHVIQSPGGVERYIRNFLKYSDRKKFYNILVCSHAYRQEEYIELADKFIYVDMVREISMQKDFLAICALRKIIKKEKPDIIYCHSSKAGAIGRVANIGRNNICIYNPHGWAFNMRGSTFKRLIYVCIEKMLAQITDKIVCISEAEQLSALNYRICKKEKTSIIYNGINMDEYEEMSNSMTRIPEIPKNAYVVGFTGRLCEQKAPDVFAKAAILIKEKIPNAFFLLVGDGELRQDIDNIFESNGLRDAYYITGWVDNPMFYIKYFDVATLLSRWEGFGLVLAEYMLAKKPIVANNVDAIPNIIMDGVNGLLVEMDDYKSVADKVEQIYNDVLLRNSLVCNGYDIVRNRFDVRRVIKEHEELFLRLKEN